MVSKTLFSSNRDNWSTPQFLFDDLNKEFHFTLDPASDDLNAKCERHYTLLDDGLSKSWAGERVWLNPPYGKTIGLWMEKAYKESLRGTLVVCLVPARTDTQWFHKWVVNCPNVVIRFIKGRLKFDDCKNAAPFPSMIVIYKPVVEV